MELNGPKVKLADGSKVILTKENVKNYLGKVIANYKTSTESDSTETIMAGTVGTGKKTCTVSKTYRLYYVDFDNKYGDGEGTIYIKADYTSNFISLPLSDKTKNTAETVKIKQLNPELYKNKKENEITIQPPSSSYDNMKAVTWLTNTVNWEELKTSGNSTEIGSSINYIVGSPSLEMMMDSYNTKYEPESGWEETPDSSPIVVGTRKKLFYQYPYNGDSNLYNLYGYGIGPCSNGSNGYGDHTSLYSVQSDDEIDPMYLPTTFAMYWISSPSCGNYGNVFVIDEAGMISGTNYGTECSVCPLVSLKPNTILELNN